MASAIAILELFTQLQNVGALGHGDDDTDGFAAVMAHDALRRVLVATLDGGDVAEPKRGAAGFDGDFRNGRLALEGTGDAYVDAIGAGLERAGGRHGVLARHAVEDGLGRDAERRQLAVAELDEDALVALADDIDLGDTLRAQETLAHYLGIVLELSDGNVRARQHVDGGIDVAVLVVEERALYALRQRRAAVVELLPHLVPGVIDVLLPRPVLELHLDDADAGPRIGPDEVEELELLQPFFELVGDLVLHLLSGGTGPCCRDDHGLDGERGVLGAAEIEVAHDPRHGEHDDEEQDHCGMRDRPSREVAARGGMLVFFGPGHGATSTMRTGIPASSL